MSISKTVTDEMEKLWKPGTDIEDMKDTIKNCHPEWNIGVPAVIGAIGRGILTFRQHHRDHFPLPGRNGHKPQTRQLKLIPEVKPSNKNVAINNLRTQQLTAIDKYRAAIEYSAFMPCDEVAAVLLGITRPAAHNIRVALEKEGYIFERTEYGWRIIQSPPKGPTPEELAKQKKIEQLENLLQAVAAQIEDMKKG